MTAETPYLFVYGTLRKAAGHPSHRLLEDGAQLVGLAHMKGRMFEIDGYPGVVPSDPSCGQVLGELYRLREPAVVLEALDDYEEAGENYPQPQEYLRCQVNVKLENGTEVVAWCYLYNRPTAGLRLIPGGNWCR
jgi:gamma-glutamylcyclotransferase (GGCT)/AIG2-like uncharacterized protein YtfP